MTPTIRIIPGALDKLVDAAVEVLRGNPVLAREEVFVHDGVLHQHLGQGSGRNTRRYPLSQLRGVLCEIAVWEKQTTCGWERVDPPSILRHLAARASEWAPPGTISHPLQVPGYWCEPETATAWLKATGWKISGKRARRSRSDIPAPRPGVLYDLHDVACEGGVGASEIVRKIVAWSGRPGVAKGGTDREPTAEQLEALRAS